MPKLPIRRPDALTLAIAAVALFGAALVLYRQSAYGVSVSADSGHYIAMARNALAGHGFMSFDGGYPPEWPPLASALYAVFSFGVFDPMAVAGPLNAAMFALTVFTAGVWLRRRAESPFVVAWACLALVFGFAAIRMFDWIWSEPSFILLTTLALYWADRHLEDGKRSSLAWAVAFSASACMSKYIGAALVVAVAGMILLRRGVSWRERFITAAAYSAISLLPICAWMARNWLNAGLLTGGRPVVETAREHVAPMLAEMAKWWLPHVPIPGAEGVALPVTVLALSGAAALALYALFRWLRADGRATAPLLAAFAAAYAALTLWGLRTGVVGMDRYAAPMFVPLLLSAALALDRVLARARGVRWSGGRIPAFALMAILAAWTAFGGYVALADARARATEHGDGRVDGGFYASETTRHLRELRGETAIGVGFSNEPLQAYLASDGRGIYPNPPYHWSEMTAALEARHGAADDTVIAWFHDGGIPKRYGVSAFLYSPGFEHLGAFRDGDVFRLKRGHPPADPRAGTQILDSHYDVYLNDGALVWVRQPCADGDAGGLVELWAEPADPDDPRADVNESGAVSMNFDFWRFGAKIGDLCAIRRPLPDYPLRRIGTGQNVPGDDEWLYRTAIQMPISGEARAYYIKKYETVAAGGDPLARGEYDVYLDGGDLVYLKQPCADEHTRGRFLLSVFPVDLGDIHPDQRAARHEGHNFGFAQYGVRFDDRCMVRRPLPDYMIKAVDVGRWVPGEAGGWAATRVRMPIGDEARAYYMNKYETVSSGEPLARGEYDVYLDGGDLVYLKQPCADEHTRGRFLLSVFPADLGDVSPKWRELGHESLNFSFEHHGVRFGDMCMIRIPLPDYAIKAVDVGRWVPGESAAWEKTRVQLPMGGGGR